MRVSAVNRRPLAPREERPTSGLLAAAEEGLSSHRARGLRWLLPLVLLAPPAASAAEMYRQPVYVGAKVCGECHDGTAMGDQLTRWLHSRHAKAYMSLATPEAKQIAKWSGIPMEPQESAMCLGCHATASEAEP